MFPYAPGLATPGQPGQLGWLPQDFGGSNPLPAASLQPSASFNSLPMFSGQHLAAMQAGAGHHNPLPNMPLGNAALGLASPGLIGGGPNTPAASPLHNASVALPAASQQQQLALAAALMSQMQAGQPTTQLFAMQPQADPGNAFAQPGSALNAWALLLAQQAAAGVLPSLPPELLQLGSGMPGLGSSLPAMLAGLDTSMFRGPPLAILPAAMEQQQVQCAGSGQMKPATPTAGQSLEGASVERAIPSHAPHSLPCDGSSTPDTSSPRSEVQARSHSKSGHKSSQQAPRQEQLPQRGLPNGHPVVDSALVERSQPGSSDDHSSASGCSQPSGALQPQKPAQQSCRGKVPSNSAHAHKATSNLQPPSPQASQQQVKSQATNTAGSKLTMKTSQGMPPPPPRGTGSMATVSAGGTQGRASTAVGSSKSVEQATILQERMRTTLGPQQWSKVRSTLLRQQTTFVQQLYELHKLNSLQKLLCLEVLGYDPSASSAGGRGPPAAGGAGDPGSRGRGRGSPGFGAGAGPSGSCLSLPSVCAPSAPRGGQARNHSTRSGASMDAPGMLQRVQQDLAQMANIPAQLRSKAKNASPDASLVSKGNTKVSCGSGDAGKAPVMHKPTAMRPLSTDAKQTSTQKAVADTVAPAPTPMGNGGGLLEAAAAFLQSTGVPLPALAPTQSASRAQASSKGAHAPALASKGTASGAPPPLLAGPGGLGFMPPPGGLQAAMPMLDPHAAWFSKHYTGGPNGSVPTGAAAVPVADMPTGTSPHGDGDTAAAVAPPVAVGPNGMPVLSAPVRWWQDETATFGDIAPSMVAPQASADGVTAKSGSKRSAKQVGAAQPGSSKKGRANDFLADEAALNTKPGAFKVVRPRKARSKRGSNRLGPGGRDSVMSDDSGSSMNQDGSCIMGMSVAAPMSVGSGVNWRINCPEPVASPPGIAGSVMHSPHQADVPRVHMGCEGHLDAVPSAADVARRRSGGGGSWGPGVQDTIHAQHMDVAMPGAGDAVHGNADAVRHSGGGVAGPAKADSGNRNNPSGSGPSGQQHAMDSSHGSEEKERSAARLLLSLSCVGSAGGLHANNASQMGAMQHGPAGSIGNIAAPEGRGQQAISISA